MDSVSANSPGRFITLEGGEGAGKSTQIQVVKDYLEARGNQVAHLLGKKSVTCW